MPLAPPVMTTTLSLSSMEAPLTAKASG